MISFSFMLDIVWLIFCRDWALVSQEASSHDTKAFHTCIVWLTIVNTLNKVRATRSAVTLGVILLGLDYGDRVLE